MERTRSSRWRTGEAAPRRRWRPMARARVILEGRDGEGEGTHRYARAHTRTYARTHARTHARRNAETHKKKNSRRGGNWCITFDFYSGRIAYLSHQSDSLESQVRPHRNTIMIPPVAPSPLISRPHRNSRQCSCITFKFRRGRISLAQKRRDPLISAAAPSQHVAPSPLLCVVEEGRHPGGARDGEGEGTRRCDRTHARATNTQVKILKALQQLMHYV